MRRVRFVLRRWLATRALNRVTRDQEKADVAVRRMWRAFDELKYPEVES